MKIWPWSRFERLERDLRLSREQTEACGLAAGGAFHALHRKSPLDCNFVQLPAPELWTPALAEIVKLVTLLDQYPEPPPYTFRNVPSFIKKDTE